MWKNKRTEKPQKSGTYVVYGTVNRGTEFECKSRYYAYWHNTDNVFTDNEGEDLTGLNESIEFWFDMDLIDNPE